MEILRKERKALRQLIKIAKKHNGYIPFELVPQYPKNNYYIKKLRNEHLIVLGSMQGETNSMGIIIYDSYYITDEGLHFFEHRWENFKNILFRSIFIPIIVAFLTALVTQHFAPWIWHSISKMFG